MYRPSRNKWRKRDCSFSKMTSTSQAPHLTILFLLSSLVGCCTSTLVNYGDKINLKNNWPSNNNNNRWLRFSVDQGSEVFTFDINRGATRLYELTVRSNTDNVEFKTGCLRHGDEIYLNGPFSDNGPTWMGAELPTGSKVHTISILDPKFTYRWRVQKVQGENCVHYDDAIYLEIENNHRLTGARYTNNKKVFTRNMFVNEYESGTVKRTYEWNVQPVNANTSIHT